MKDNKLMTYVICTAIAIVAIATAIFIFRKEIADCVANFMDKVEAKKLHHNGEYDDYADI